MATDTDTNTKEDFRDQADNDRATVQNHKKRIKDLILLAQENRVRIDKLLRIKSLSRTYNDDAESQGGKSVTFDENTNRDYDTRRASSGRPSSRDRINNEDPLDDKSITPTPFRGTITMHDEAGRLDTNTEQKIVDSKPTLIGQSPTTDKKFFRTLSLKLNFDDEGKKK